MRQLRALCSTPGGDCKKLPPLSNVHLIFFIVGDNEHDNKKLRQIKNGNADADLQNKQRTTRGWSTFLPHSRGTIPNNKKNYYQKGRIGYFDNLIIYNYNLKSNLTLDLMI